MKITFKDQFGIEHIREIPNKQWAAFLSNSLIQANTENVDPDKIITLNGFKWFIDND